MALNLQFLHRYVCSFTVILIMSKLLLHPSLQHILRFIVDQSTFGGRSKGDAASKSHYAAPLVPARAGEWQCVRITDGPQQDNQFRALAQPHSVLVFLFQILASHTLVCIFVCPAACGSSHHHMIWRIHLIFFFFFHRIITYLPFMSTQNFPFWNSSFAFIRVDCGLFICKLADFISSSRMPNFEAQHAAYFRQRMVLELLSCRID